MMHFRNANEPSILILGASARAAAFSALAAGVQPTCGDLFGDADLLARCVVTAVTDYPASLEHVARSVDTHVPWIYTGGLENYPEVVSRIAAERRLLGNDAAVLGCVRDPWAVAACLRRAGCWTPELRSTSDGLPLDGRWLIKNRRSSGGSGVFVWRGEGTPSPNVRPPSESYFQERIAGRPVAALFVAARGEALLLGATEQLIVGRRGGEDSFRYAGSVGPIALAAQREAALKTIGTALADEFGLQGLFGVDLIDDGAEWRVIEVNPRFPASAEILERGFDFAAVTHHVAACRDGSLLAAPTDLSRAWHGKRIVYSPADALIDSSFVHDAMHARGVVTCPQIADIPVAGTQLRIDRPALTVFAQGSSRPELLANLDKAAAEWTDRIKLSALCTDAR